MWTLIYINILWRCVTIDGCKTRILKLIFVTSIVNASVYINYVVPGSGVRFMVYVSVGGRAFIDDWGSGR